MISLVLAGLFWFISRFLLPPDSAPSTVASYIAYANLLLGLFNTVPGFPLDGGRVFRSIVWGATGDMLRATQIASYVGQAVAFVLIGWGVLQALGGDVFGGLWIGFIGWFLNSGAEASRQQATVERALARVPVTRVMDSSPEYLSPQLNVSDFVLEHALRRGQRAMPVVDAGQLVGIMSLTDAKHLNQEAWPTTKIGDVMTHVPLKTLGLDANVAAALQLMLENGLHQLPIVQNGALVGVVTRADVMSYIQSAPGLPERSSGRTEGTARPKAAPSHG